MNTMKQKNLETRQYKNKKHFQKIDRAANDFLVFDTWCSKSTKSFFGHTRIQITTTHHEYKHIC